MKRISIPSALVPADTLVGVGHGVTDGLGREVAYEEGVPRECRRLRCGRQTGDTITTICFPPYSPGNRQQRPWDQ